MCILVRREIKAWRTTKINGVWQSYNASIKTRISPKKDKNSKENIAKR